MNLTKEQLIQTATELNEVMGLEPPIPLDTIEEVLLSEIKREINEVVVTDEFSDTTWRVLATLDCQIAIGKGYKPIEGTNTEIEESRTDEEEDFEPYTVHQLRKYPIYGLVRILKDFYEAMHIKETVPTRTQHKFIVPKIMEAQNQWLVNQGKEPIVWEHEKVEEEKPPPQYKQEETDTHHKDGTPKIGRRSVPLYGGYNMAQIKKMKTWSLQKFLKERFGCTHEEVKPLSKDEMVELAMTREYVPYTIDEEPHDYLTLHTGRQRSKTYDKPKGRKALYRDDACIEALKVEDEDIERAVIRAREFYVKAGGRDNERYMREAMYRVLKTLKESDGELGDKAKMFASEFKMTR